MWRKKHGFDDFVEIVKEMPFLQSDREYTTYRYYNPNTGRYEREPPEILNKDGLMRFVNGLEQTFKDNYGEDGNGSVMPLEEYKILRLITWCRQRNYNATKEFRETRQKVEYFKRLGSYENN